MLRFDRAVLTAQLKLLPYASQIAFAATCAQRLHPIFVRGAQDWGWDSRPSEFARLLGMCWALAGNPRDSGVLSQLETADWRALAKDSDRDEFQGYRPFVFPRCNAGAASTWYVSG